MKKIKMLIKSRIKYLVRFFYRWAFRYVKPAIDFPACIQIQSPIETLNVCRRFITEKTRGVFLRFGDGDVNLLTRRSEKMQTANPNLAKEMQDTFNLEGPGIMKGLSLHSPRFGIWPGMSPGIFGLDDTSAMNLLSNCYYYFIGSQIYSSVALQYLAVFEPAAALDFLKFLKDQNPPIFIGNENIPEQLILKLFGKTNHIKTPDRNSYDAIDRIELETIRHLKNLDNKFHVIMLAMGCSGRVLAKRIYSKHEWANVFLFDFSSLLDALCGWSTRKWIDIAPYDVKELLNHI